MLGPRIHLDVASPAAQEAANPVRESAPDIVYPDCHRGSQLAECQQLVGAAGRTGMRRGDRC